jgi:chromosome segregation ATPase
MQKAAKYVESSIPFKDLTSMFLFENSEDMHLFLNEVRECLNIPVNAAIIPRRQLNSFNPPKSIESLKKHGFFTYLIDTIEAPEPILVYMCLFFNIHQVPIGNETTHKNINKILPDIPEYSRFYTHTHQYNISKSRYSNKVTSSSNDVPESYWLTSSINQNELASLEEQEKNIKQKLKEIEMKLTANQEEKLKVEKKIESLRAEMLKIREKRLYIEKLSKQISSTKLMLTTLESQNIDLLAEAKKRLEKTCEYSKNKVKLFTDYLVQARNLVVLNKDKTFAVYQDAEYQSEKTQLENGLRDYLNRKQELETNLEEYQSKLKEAKDEAKSALDEASKVNEINLEKGIPDAYKVKFGTLPDSVERIENEIHQSEAIFQCATNVDLKTVEEYHEREKLIKNLEKDFEKKKEKLIRHQNNYESMKNEWIESVEEMIKDINEKFSGLFLQLKCAGEVSLGRPDNSEEFSKYGICIKVSFRSEEKLQELTAWQQSGGEKSVSTMMYMIALQEMTKCPFRVVDEINQGMDPINERKVFDIIVQNSCSKQFAQYFLLTPKLLPDLSFDDKTNVICVFNGPHNIPHLKYNLKKILDNRRKLNQN